MNAALFRPIGTAAAADLYRVYTSSSRGSLYGSVSYADYRDFARATVLIDEALRRDPEHVPSLRLRARLAAMNKEPELEERLLGRYLARVPDSAGAYQRLGELALAGNRLEDARRAFLQAYELRPQPSTARHLAELAQRRGDALEARLWQERAGTTSTREQQEQATQDQ